MRHALALLILVAGISSLPLSARAQWQYNGVALSTAANFQLLPTIVSDGAGGAIVTWQDHRNNDFTGDIYAQRVDASGTAQWTADGVALCTAVGDQYLPTIASDGAGGAIVTWSDFRSGTRYDIYAQRVDASGAPQWTDNGVALCVVAGGQPEPMIVSDGAGGAIVTWHNSRTGTFLIYAQRVDASGAPQWTDNGVALSPGGSDQRSPMIVSDGAGGAIVTWQDYRSGINYDIYARRVNASGAPQWTADGVLLCVAADHQVTPTIVSDGAGGAIVTWYDYRSGTNSDIYAQLVNALGTLQWPDTAVAVCTAANEQVYPTIDSDGTGGAIVTWYDFRSGTNNDIYAQLVNASGTTQWTADGVALCTAAFDQKDPTIVSDGAGGAIVTWYDARSDTASDIYTQRVSALGVPQWTADGVALCTAASYQWVPTIVSDGAGGAIVTWHDDRIGSNSSDIYAQHVNASGAVPTAVSRPTRGPSLRGGEIYPNPLTGTASLDIELGAPSAVQIEVFDVAGRRVRAMTLRDAAGSQRVEFDGRDDAGRLLPSGVYFYRLKATGETITRKMVIAR